MSVRLSFLKADPQMGIWVNFFFFFGEVSREREKGKQDRRKQGAKEGDNLEACVSFIYGSTRV